MAKKVVATLKKGTGKDYVKVIRMVRSPKSGAYMFEEEMVYNENLKDYLDSKKQ